MRKLKTLHVVTFWLVIVGALNWGLIGLFGFNLVNVIFGSWPMVETLVYVLVGVAAVYRAFAHFQDCKICAMKKRK